MTVGFVTVGFVTVGFVGAVPGAEDKTFREHLVRCARTEQSHDIASTELTSS